MGMPIQLVHQEIFSQVIILQKILTEISVIRRYKNQPLPNW